MSRTGVELEVKETLRCSCSPWASFPIFSFKYRGILSYHLSCFLNSLLARGMVLLSKKYFGFVDFHCLVSLCEKHLKYFLPITI